MPNPATIEIAPDTKSRVEKLAADTHRSAQDIVTEAVEAYLEFDMDYVRRVKRGIAEADRGEFAEQADVKAAFGKFKVDY
jgi:predicted transcriptional regulator